MRMGHRLPFSLLPPLSPVPIPLPSYFPTSIKGIALRGEVSDLLAKGAIELTPPSPGFYNRLFVVWKTSGSWRPVFVEQVCSSDSLQDGVQPVGPQFHSEEQLDGLHRPEGCIPSGSHAFRQLSVFPFCGGRGGLSVSGTLFRPFHGSTCLHQGHGSSFSDASRHGSLDTLVSG